MHQNKNLHLPQGEPIEHITDKIYKNPTSFPYGEVIDAYMMVYDRMQELHEELNQAKELAHKWRAQAQPFTEMEWAFPWELQQEQTKDVPNS